MAPLAKASQKKAERLNIRVTEDEKSLVEQAARLSRMNASQFVLQAALLSAESVVAEQTRFVLPPDKWDEFVALLDQPARDLPAVERLARKPSRFVEE